MRFSCGFSNGLVQFSVLSALLSGIAFAGTGDQALKGALPPIVVESAEIPQAALDLAKSFLDELVLMADLPVDQARQKGNVILQKYFGTVLESDFLAQFTLERAAPEMNPKPNLNVSLEPKMQQAKLEKAMVQALFRENARHLFLNVVRDIRGIEKTKLADPPAFFDENLGKKLLSIPLTYSLGKMGKQVYRPKSASTDYHVPVKLIPEVEKYNESVDLVYVVRKDIKGNFYLSDFIFNQSISAMVMHYDLMRQMIFAAAKTEDCFSDLIHSRQATQSMQRWGVDELRWKALALDFLGK